MAHFGLAYQLQQKLDAEFFAIIDTSNKPKKMFENQKMINLFVYMWEIVFITTMTKEDLLEIVV